MFEMITWTKFSLLALPGIVSCRRHSKDPLLEGCEMKHDLYNEGLIAEQNNAGGYFGTGSVARIYWQV